MHTTYHLPQNLRKELKKPIGTLYPDNILLDRIRAELKQPTEKVIAIGDITTKNLLDANIAFDLAVIDKKTRRKYNAPAIHLPANCKQIPVHNPPATITQELFSSIKQAISQKMTTVIIVDGEEDLAVLPAVILAPVTSIVIYGQPDEGAILVRVNSPVKQKVQKLLSYFTSTSYP